MALIVFCIGDFFWLYFVMNKLFIYQIKHLMKMTSGGIEINYFSAFGAYLIISLGLTHFVIQPYFLSGYQQLFMQGAFFGFCMYAVYELTNRATLIEWPLSFVCIDILWGTFWCGTVSAIAVYLNLLLHIKK